MATSFNDRSTPPENMSVSELREWLKRFEKKHQDHYQQNTFIHRRSPTQTGRRQSIRGRIFGLEKPEVENGSVIADENSSQQENNGANPPSAEVLRWRTDDLQQENHRPSIVNQVHDVKKDVQVQKSRHDSISSPPFIGEVTPTSSKGADSFEQASVTNKGLPNDLCLALSAVTMGLSSSSVEAEASESVASDDSLGVFDLEPDVKASQQPKQPEGRAKTAVQSRAKPTVKHQSTTKIQECKPVPKTWSDFDPVDFDASFEDSSFSEEEKEDVFPTSKSWPTWNSDPRGYLKKQSAQAFQGYWSDKDCDEDDKDNDADDDNSAATGRKTEPPRSWYNKEGATRNRGRFNDPFTMKVSSEDDASATLSLFDVARDSVAGEKAPKRTRSLSEHFIVGTKRTTSSPKATRGGRDSPWNRRMHSANLIENATMTAGALDAICNNGKVSSPTMLDEGKDNKLETFFERGDQGTISSWSVDSGKPSVAPNAVDPKLAKVFSSNYSESYTIPVSAREIRQPVQKTRRSAYGEGRDAAPSPVSNTSFVKDSFVKAAHTNTATTTTTAISSQAQVKAPKNEKSPASAFTSVRERFGGGAGRASRKSRIQRQKEALEEQWASNRQVKHVRKTKWQVSRSGGGTYKKKVVLDFEDK